MTDPGLCKKALEYSLNNLVTLNVDNTRCLFSKGQGKEKVREGKASKEGRREKEIKKSFTCWSTAQMATMIRAESG